MSTVRLAGLTTRQQSAMALFARGHSPCYVAHMLEMDRLAALALYSESTATLASRWGIDGDSVVSEVRRVLGVVFLLLLVVIPAAMGHGFDRARTKLTRTRTRQEWYVEDVS